MNTKEAIEFLKNRHKYVLNRGSAFYISKTNEAIDQIIEIAERGKEYEQMWGECKKYMGVNAWVPVCEFKNLINIRLIKNVMNYYEQKYLKEASHDYPELLF